MANYTITTEDLVRYKAGRNSKIDEIWWEVLQKLPKYLFSEALQKGFGIEETNPEMTSSQNLKLAVPNASPELRTFIQNLGISIGCVTNLK